jgi:predicted Zn-dependent peptidase
LTSFADEPPTDAEFARARALIERIHLDAIIGILYRSYRLAENAAVHDDPERVNTYLDRMDAVDASRVQAIARDVFQKDNRVVLTFLKEENR